MPSRSISLAASRIPAVSETMTGKTGEIQPHFDDVARRTCFRRDDRRVAPRQRVEQARLAGIRRAQQGDPEALPQDLAAMTVVEMSGDFRPRAPTARFARFGEATTPTRRPRRRNRWPLRSVQRSRSVASASRRRASRARRRLGPVPGGAGLRFRLRRDRRGLRPRRGRACRSRRRDGRIRRALRGGIPRSRPAPIEQRRSTARLPWTWNSATSSPVSLDGASNQSTTAPIERFAGRRMPDSPEGRRARLRWPRLHHPVSASRAAGPDTRMTATPARPGALESAKIVEASVMGFAYS